MGLQDVCAGRIELYSLRFWSIGTTSASEFGISGDIVIRMCKNLPVRKFYKLYCDNWFTSPQLFMRLHNLGILPTGTVRQNSLPNCTHASDKELRQQGRSAYDWRIESTSNLVLWNGTIISLFIYYPQWREYSPLIMWSDGVWLINLSLKSRVQTLSHIITSIWEALTFMICLFYFNLVDACIVNAWLLYRRRMAQKKITKIMPLIILRAEIAYSLQKVYKPIVRKRGRPSKKKERSTLPKPSDDVRYDQLGHFPVYCANKQWCRLCIKADSRWKCEKCQLNLCLNDYNCF